MSDVKAEDLARPFDGNHAAAEGGTPKGPSYSTQALQLAAQAGARSWMNESGEAHITIPMNGHVEHYRLKSDPDSPPGRWLGRMFYQNSGKALPSAAKKDALENLIAEAMCSENAYISGRRVIRSGDRIFLDLCAPDWEVVEITSEGWSVLPAGTCPVRFTRSGSMLALPRPERGGTLDGLRPFFNCGDEDFRLIVAWVLAALSGGREYPILVFGGEPGAAKSTATTYARALVDPNSAPLRKTPDSPRDLYVAASNAFVLTFDNLSTPPAWLADVLCAVALGTGYACRALYTDDGETVFRVACPIILNGISEQLTRSDLADRAFGVTLNRLKPEEVKPKDDLDAAFERVRPQALGALLTVLSGALARLPGVVLERYPRMAQTAKLMAAAEPALGWEPGTFSKLFSRAQQSVAANVIEDDPVVQALNDLVRRGGGRFTFLGSATELGVLIKGFRPNPMPTVWPPAPNKLSERIRRLAPQLRLMGWEINPDGRDGTRNNGRRIRLVFPNPLSLYVEERGEASEPSDRPKANVAGETASDSPGPSIVCERPGQSDAGGWSIPTTIEGAASSAPKLSPALHSERSDDADDSDETSECDGQMHAALRMNPDPAQEAYV